MSLFYLCALVASDEHYLILWPDASSVSTMLTSCQDEDGVCLRGHHTETLLGRPRLHDSSTKHHFSKKLGDHDR